MISYFQSVQSLPLCIKFKYRLHIKDNIGYDLDK
jgi:hypothetical protein